MNKKVGKNFKTRKFLIFCALHFFIFCGADFCLAQDIFVRTLIDDHHDLHLITKAGKDIFFKRETPGDQGDAESMQVGFDQIKISDDGTAVGWLATFPNCCTSYPISMSLHVYTNKKHYVFEGKELPISDWVFIGSEKVAFHQETVHGGRGVRYEMREIKTHRLLNEYQPLVDDKGQELESEIPAWVRQYNLSVEKYFNKNSG